MYEKFANAFEAAGDPPIRQGGPHNLRGGRSLDILQNRFGGASFRRGLYRIVGLKKRAEWGSRISTAFPGSDVICFGYDWLGRALAFDATGSTTNRGAIKLFEPGTGEIMESEVSNIEEFHDKLLLDEGDDVLSGNFFTEWLDYSGVPPDYDQCVGYKVPLFLEHVPS